MDLFVWIMYKWMRIPKSKFKTITYEIPEGKIGKSLLS